MTVAVFLVVKTKSTMSVERKNYSVEQNQKEDIEMPNDNKSLTQGLPYRVYHVELYRLTCRSCIIKLLLPL